MRALLWITTAAAVLYGGYWVAGSTAMRRGAEAALADLQAQGIAGPAEITLHGFPSRFDLTVEPVALRSGAVEWSAPFVQLFMLAYRPTHLIAVWPNEQTLTLNGLPLTITSTDMRASAVVGVSADLPLDRTVLVAEDLAISAGADLGVRLTEARLATRATDAGRLVHDLGAELLGLTLSPGLRAAADPEGTLPEAMDWLRLNAALTLDRPLDRHAASAPPRPVALDLRDLSLRWGDLSLTASGQLTRGGDGRLQGRIEIDADHWREILALAVATGLVRAELAPTYAAALEQLAAVSGTDPDRLQVPLVLSGGWITLGPLPIGIAPRI
ncbi:DUF2125 domain-containing protein [Frigidibacter albus]|uniref:DUF2125 domain-containing protein n=1 Tax=Frigidibacter albus TaxID=1465486 RepID=A0A6L8VEY6_9RHOB|nr:DUF2125 domain-containing protein [Frigidibacter albus]MZQ88885.1 DUF2125 domain-containing protein [Frigidibacter albus]NBE31058.1 DUF2125 domain-containing protein [Frigidibacter albus]GGH52608.1 hypothetical protein GCM10011341_17300 [Frigidibacter albus]